jgi:hypothetical protein
MLLLNEESVSSHDRGCMVGLLIVLYVCVFGAEDVARPRFVAVSAVCVQKLAACVVLRRPLVVQRLFALMHSGFHAYYSILNRSCNELQFVVW